MSGLDLLRLWIEGVGEGAPPLPVDHIIEHGLFIDEEEAGEFGFPFHGSDDEEEQGEFEFPFHGSDDKEEDWGSVDSGYSTMTDDEDFDDDDKDFDDEDHDDHYDDDDDDIRARSPLNQQMPPEEFLRGWRQADSPVPAVRPPHLTSSPPEVFPRIVQVFSLAGPSTSLAPPPLPQRSEESAPSTSGYSSATKRSREEGDTEQVSKRRRDEDYRESAPSTSGLGLFSPRRQEENYRESAPSTSGHISATRRSREEGDTEQKNSHPKLYPGDIVEYPRNRYFSHFGVYYGERDGVPYVAHLTCRDSDQKLLLFGRALRSEVKLDPLDLVGKKYKVSNMLDDSLPARDFHSVVNQAIDDMLGREVTFDILFHNSEPEQLSAAGQFELLQMGKVYKRIMPAWKKLFKKKQL